MENIGANSKINTIVFDIGNVLAPFGWEKVFAEMFDEKTAARVAEATVLNRKLWDEFDRGSLSDEEIIQSFKDYAPDVADKIESAIWEIYRRKTPFDYADKWMSHLKEQGYRIYLLSNYGRTAFNMSKPQFTFLKYVDGGVISYQVEITKPDPRIYMILCQKYGISPNEAVFIDDNKDNISAAKELGFNVVLHEDEKSSKEKFKALGIEVEA